MKKNRISLFANINFEGLESLRKFSADSYFKVEATCTGRTNVRAKILES